VTLPDGTTQGFTFQPTVQYLPPLGGWLPPLMVIYHPAFVADAGTFSTLTAPDTDLQLISNEYLYEGEDLRGYNPADPFFGGTYTLTTSDGLAYKINASTGAVQSLTDRNGNQLTFASTTITSNRGATVAISRDFQNRITAITDPRGNQVKYAYSPAGDLISVIDRVGVVSF
jgi:YD repeat-containing protein